jgi:hypothetical protein
MHRPESWGYVQFTKGQPGEVAFRPDPTHAARHWLHQVYYAQQAYRKRHQRYAERLEDLKVPAPSGTGLSDPILRSTDHAFEASIEWRPRVGSPGRWHIRQDSLVWQ